MLELTAVRHGETTFNAAGLLTGRRDPPLTARGREQAQALAPLVRMQWDVVAHSGARRARDTLALACAAAGAAVPAPRADPRWLERGFGDLEGRPAAAWRQPADVDAAPPGGESYRTLGLRVHAALTDVAQAGPGRVLLVAHSGVLRMLQGIASGAETLAPLLADGARPGEAVALRYARIELPPFLAS
jgi:probable phosphoglycerate mutase